MSELHKTLVAELPPMRPQDFAAFEAEGGVWGKQRAIRRKQVYCMCGGGLAGAVLGTSFAAARKNTFLVKLSLLPLFALSGMVIGHAGGLALVPSVADNKETTMMRRLWWAKKCAENYDYSQVDGHNWKAAYPHYDISALQK
jgi:hypothetical protein